MNMIADETGTASSEDGASSEWSTLGTELLRADPEIHDQALEAIRVIARNIRARRRERLLMSVPMFGTRKAKGSA